MPTLFRCHCHKCCVFVAKSISFSHHKDTDNFSHFAFDITEKYGKYWMASCHRMYIHVGSVWFVCVSLELIQNMRRKSRDKNEKNGTFCVHHNRTDKFFSFSGKYLTSCFFFRLFLCFCAPESGNSQSQMWKSKNLSECCTVLCMYDEACLWSRQNRP